MCAWANLIKSQHSVRERKNEVNDCHHVCMTVNNENRWSHQKPMFTSITDLRIWWLVKTHWFTLQSKKLQSCDSTQTSVFYFSLNDCNSDLPELFKFEISYLYLFVDLFIDKLATKTFHTLTQISWLILSTTI